MAARELDERICVERNIEGSDQENNPTEQQNSQQSHPPDMSEEERRVRNKRKQLRGKITRSINRLHQSIEGADQNKRRLQRILSEIKTDYSVACEYHGQLYDFVSSQEVPRLDQWENELANDVYDIEEYLEDYFQSMGSAVNSVVYRPVTRAVTQTLHDLASPVNVEQNVDVPVQRENQSAPNEEAQSFPRETTDTQTYSDSSQHSSQSVRQPIVSRSQPSLSFDSWIDSLIEFNETVLSASVREMSISEALFKIEASKDIPTITLDKFDGNPLKYVDFMERFKIHIHDKPHLTDDIRMVQLRMHLSGDAERAISGLGASGIMYATALKCIKEEFGQPSSIARACVKRLTIGSKLNARDRQSLRDFSLDVINCISTLNRIGYHADINASDNLRQIVRRLPDFLIGKWKSVAAETREKGQNPTINQVSDLIRKQVRAEFDPDFGDIQLGGGRNEQSDRRKALHANQPRVKSLKCYICEENHRISECPTFKDSTVGERVNLAKNHRLCFSCLIKGHNISECRSKKPCSQEGCNRSHHILLHSNPSPVRTGIASVLDRDGIMPVVRVQFRSLNGRMREGNVLIDSGAGTTVIRRDFAKALGLQGKRERIDISVVGGEMIPEPHSRRVKFFISSLNGDENHLIEAHEIEKTILSVPPLDRSWLKSFSHLSDISFSHKAGPVDLILGVQYSHLHVDEETRQGKPFEPVSKRTPLGWYVLGSDNSKRVSSLCAIGHFGKIDLETFYAMETLGVQRADCSCGEKAMSVEDNVAIKSFEQSCERVNNRYTIGLPWKVDPCTLPDNYDLAQKRLLSLERSLLRDPMKAELYKGVMTEYLEKGWAVEMTETEINKRPSYYLPHHGVYRPDKQSTPLRVVFDPACPYKGISLNSYLYKGPCLIGNLLGVLIRFREDRVALMGDISKMYLQICLPEADTYVHRFLWRDLDVTRSPSTYRLLRVTFGDKSSPDMASFVILRIAEEVKDTLPQAATVLSRDRYMDDLIHSCATQVEAKSTIEQLDRALSMGSFQIKEWFCSGTQNTNSEDSEGVEAIPLNKGTPTKVLGMTWDVQQDTIRYDVKAMDLISFTKRAILSKVSGIFDPLGLASPITIKVRIALQDIWRKKQFDWDDELPEEYQRIWVKLFGEIQQLSQVEFPRSLKPPGAQGVPELHVFCDASTHAYGAAAYVVWTTSNGDREVNLASAKARVAPLRQTTIPRLELMGALIGSRLARTIVDEFKLKPDRVTLWTDSQIVLHWINSESFTLKAFVGVRVSEIQSTWETKLWRYVPTKLNPADDLSRGLFVSEMEHRWKHGPAFLQQPENHWPENAVTNNVEDTEQKTVQTISSVSQIHPIMDPTNYSSWQRLVRVTGYIRRFCHNLRNYRDTEKLWSGALQPEEIDQAERYWITVAQRGLGDWKKKCQDLSAFEENGIVRVGGRLRKSPLTYDQIHPYLLPANHHISKLLLRQTHDKMGHVGAERTLSENRRKFWIVKGRSMARSVVRDCVVCRKLRQPAHSTLMADLPQERMNLNAPPFSVTGVDLFGPFSLKYGRNKSQKAWGAIFTCATVRAIHLEIVDGLSTQAFLHAVRRFAAHHGWPNLFISDNGTSFVGAHKELKKLLQDGKHDIGDFASQHRASWRFITPLSPHQGGLYESLIKQVKRGIQVAIGQQLLSWNEMATIFAEVKSLINSRPIGYASNHPDDLQPLTPNHFILGRASPSVPQGYFEETKNLNKRFEYMQTLVLHFWKRFTREYIPTLIKRTKWRSEGRQMQIGDVVLLIDQNTPRGKWELAKVIDTYPGDDGIIRNVKVRTNKGEYKRCVQKCCVILPNSD